MKYLKAFETYYNYDDEYDKLIESVLEFANTHLVYFVDNGFEIDVFDSSDHGLDFNICKPLSDGDNSTMQPFTWIEVKDHIIPFLEVLTDEFSYDYLEICGYENDGHRRFRLGSGIHDAFLQGKFPLTKQDNPKEELKIREIELKNIRFKK